MINHVLKWVELSTSWSEVIRDYPRLSEIFWHYLNPQSPWFACSLYSTSNQFPDWAVHTPCFYMQSVVYNSHICNMNPTNLLFQTGTFVPLQIMALAMWNLVCGWSWVLICSPSLLLGRQNMWGCNGACSLFEMCVFCQKVSAVMLAGPIWTVVALTAFSALAEDFL